MAKQFRNSLLFIFLFLLLWVLVACKLQSPAPDNIQQASGYVLSGSNITNGFKNNALTLIDFSTRKVLRQIKLPKSWAKNFNIDPYGRIWIGYSGHFDHGDNRVEVYDSSGNLIQTFRPCDDPEAGIQFTNGKAFIACAEKGFSGKIVILDLETFKTIKEIELSLPGKPLLLITSAVNTNNVLISGLTRGDSDNERDTSFTYLILIDATQLKIRSRIGPLPDTDVWDILPYQGKFILLNVASWKKRVSPRNDIILLTPSDPPIIATKDIGISPLWGTIKNNDLYIFHNPTWNQPNSDPQRMISRYNFITGKVIYWNLPDGWEAEDLSIVQNKLVLSQWENDQDDKDGLYLFDQDNGKLQQIINIPDASRLQIRSLR